jgi:hypothetical protein
MDLNMISNYFIAPFMNVFHCNIFSDSRMQNVIPIVLLDLDDTRTDISVPTDTFSWSRLELHWLSLLMQADYWNYLRML